LRRVATKRRQEKGEQEQKVAKVLVIGASKGIGLEAVRQALEAGYEVRAMARSAGNIALRHEKLEKFPGDALQAEDIAAALQGVDVVIQALGVAPGPQMVLGPITLFSQSTSLLLPAMEKARVRRLLSVTGFGAGDSKSKIGCLQRIPFRLLLGRAYDDKDIQEDMIRESGLDWVIARPGVLTRGPRRGRYRVLVTPAEWRNGIISRAEVADFLVRQIDGDDHLGKTPVLVY
jgi:uncharacterized protein YbjT (DUF2867 family)